MTQKTGTDHEEAGDISLLYVFQLQGYPYLGLLSGTLDRDKDSQCRDLVDG